MEKAVEYLRTKGIAKAEKRAGKQTSEGVIGSYIHHNGKVGVHGGGELRDGFRRAHR